MPFFLPSLLDIIGAKARPFIFYYNPLGKCLKMLRLTLTRLWGCIYQFRLSMEITLLAEKQQPGFYLIVFT